MAIEVGIRQTLYIILCALYSIVYCRRISRWTKYYQDYLYTAYSDMNRWKKSKVWNVKTDIMDETIRRGDMAGSSIWNLGTQHPHDKPLHPVTSLMVQNPYASQVMEYNSA